MNSNDRMDMELGSLRWVPWLAGLAVFGLAGVLYWSGVLHYPVESLIEVTLREPVPGLRSHLRPGSVSRDGRTVMLPGNPTGDDATQVMAAFRKTLTGFHDDPGQLITTYGQVPLIGVIRDNVIRILLPWAGLAFGVGALCRLWIGLGAVSRVMVVVGESVGGTSTGTDLRALETRMDTRMKTLEAGIGAVGGRAAALEVSGEELKRKQEATAQRMDEWAEVVKAVGVGLKSLKEEVAGLAQPEPDPRIDGLMRDLTKAQEQVGGVVKELGKTGSALKALGIWKAGVEPHLEAFGQESKSQIEHREGFKQRIREATARVGQIQPLPKVTDDGFDSQFAMWKQVLGQAMGVRVLEADAGMDGVLREVLKKLRDGPEIAVVLEGPPGVGKGAILRALPAFFDAGWAIPAGDEAVLRPEEGWFADAMWGYPEGMGYREGILTRAMLRAVERDDRPWMLIDELNELPGSFKVLFSGSKDTLFAKSGPREVVLYDDAKTRLALTLPSRFRVVMARNPGIRAFDENGEFDDDPAWKGRVAVYRIPPMSAAGEERLLRRWLGSKGGDFFGEWAPLTGVPSDVDSWLPKLCAVVEASRRSHNGGKDPGWRYAETGTGVVRAIIRDASRKGGDMTHALEEQLREKLLSPIREHVHDPGELATFRKVLETQGFKGLASVLQ